MTPHQTRRPLLITFSLLLATHFGCGSSESSPDAAPTSTDGGSPGTKPDLSLGQPDVAPAVPDTAVADLPQARLDGPTTVIDSPPVTVDGATVVVDGGAVGIDGPAAVYSCGAFALGSEWTTAAGFRSAIVAKDGLLSAPIALTFAGGAFGTGAYVADQGTNQVLRLDEKTGAITTFIAGAQWPKAPGLLTGILWDGDNAFDGKLYVADQGGDGDADSTVFRSDANGAAQVFLAAPGPGLDDIYGMAFSPGGSYPAGLYIGGDTDGSGAPFGVFSASGAGVAFGNIPGVEGLAIDKSGRFGGGLFATMPAGGGYPGDDSLSRILPDGTKATPLVAGVPGIHAIVFAPAGPFGGDAYVASWESQKILRVKPDGTTSDLATGLSLTNYDGNILAFSPDGRVLFVADRSNRRIVCIEGT